MIARFSLVSFFFFSLATTVSADFPEIAQLNNQDPFFRQMQADIAQYHSAAAQSLPLPALVLYSYKGKSDDNLIALSARFSLTADTIASLNRIELSTADVAGKILLVPNQPGLFVPAPPKSEIERAMEASRAGTLEPSQKITAPVRGIPTTFRYFPGAKFNSVERAFFFNVIFKFPVEIGRITSSYGTRVSPISGSLHVHEGIDIGAPSNTPVLAARDGKVAIRGTDKTLGNYIVLSHGNGYNTIYGHLSAFEVDQGREVKAGEVIGRVGSTGQSTGPHLHFEVRKEGQSLDPATFLPRAR
jgi:murein DD-endopeptidase MepM/ murein hydrolase activator NlpD